MRRFRSTQWMVLLICVLALLAGLAAAAVGEPRPAQWLWRAACLPALVLLLHGMARSLLRGEAGLDILALVSISGALLLGQDLTGAVIAVMLASGRALEHFAQQRAQREMSALLARTPRHANRYDGERLAQVPLDQVRPGDKLLVKSGDVVPVDGTLVSGLAVLDESALTGEAVPVEHAGGQELRSGTLNAAAAFDMVATTTAADSTYAGVVRLVQAAQDSKAPASRLADRYALWFVPASLLLAGLAWLLSGDPLRGLAVIVVATPCPLLLAVPVAIVAGMSNCARRGILVKGGAALERLAQATLLFFDKTGTLTGGRARLAEIETDPGFSRQEVLRIAASLDQMSSHVIAAAVVAAAHEHGLTLGIPSGVHEQPGAGLSGMVEGRQAALGTHAYVSTFAASPAWADALAGSLDRNAGATVFVAFDGRMIGALLLADQIRLETPRALRLLRRAGIRRLVMVTGDRQDVALAIGNSLGIDEVHAELDPSAKLAVLTAGRAQGTTLMVGDGINDAPALAAADVGVAMGARGAAASSEAADVVLLVDRLDRLAEAVHAARLTRAIAVQSVFAGMGLSIAAMVMAALGHLPPLAGAVLQEVIDVAVILNALRALRIMPLRSSRHSLPATATRQLQAEHERLQPVLDHLSALAESLSLLPDAQAAQALAELDASLRERLLPHEHADDATLYPSLATLLGGDDPLAAMSRSHREIFDLGNRLHRCVEQLDSAGLSADARRELQRILYSLDAILRLHFAQEEEIYHGLG